jgi:hypothetical protein
LNYNNHFSHALISMEEEHKLQRGSKDGAQGTVF